MSNWRTMIVDAEDMEPGKFYTIQTNKDNVTALFEVKNISASAHYGDFDTGDFNVDADTNKITFKNSIEGLDLSGFTLKPKTVRYGIYKFVNKLNISIDLDIPSNVEASVVGVEEQNITTKVIRPMSNVDYQYDPVTKKWNFNFGVVKTGQVIIAFYV